MKRFCVNCGKELNVDVKYCPYCGTKAQAFQSPAEEKSQEESAEAKVQQMPFSGDDQARTINVNFAKQAEVVKRKEKTIEIEKNINSLQKIRSLTYTILLFIPIGIIFFRWRSFFPFGLLIAWLVADRVLANVISKKKRERDGLKLQNEKDKLNAIATTQELARQEDDSTKAVSFQAQRTQVPREKIEPREQELSRFLGFNLVASLIIAIPLLIASLILVFAPLISLIVTEVSLFDIVKDGVIGMFSRDVEGLEYYSIWEGIVKECSPTILSDLLLQKMNLTITPLLTSALLLGAICTGVQLIISPILNYYKFKNNAQFKSAYLYNYGKVKPKYMREIFKHLFSIAISVIFFLTPVLMLWNLPEYFDFFIDSSYLYVLGISVVMLAASFIYPVIMMLNPGYRKCYYTLYKKVVNKERDEEFC